MSNRRQYPSQQQAGFAPFVPQPPSQQQILEQQQGFTRPPFTPPFPGTVRPTEANPWSVPPTANQWSAPPPPAAAAAAAAVNPWNAPPPPPPPVGAASQWSAAPPASAASHWNAPPMAPAANRWSAQPPPPPPPQGYASFPSNQLVQGGGQAGFLPPPPRAFAGGAGQVSNVVDQFQSLAFASATGSVDTRTVGLPRPAQEDPLALIVNEEWSESCHSRYFKLTTHAIPNSHSLAARWHLPLGATIQPLAEAPPGEEVPVVSFGPSGIVRCRRCRTYINPFNTFTDLGKYFRCCICAMLNEVPEDYLCPLDAEGRRKDVMERPELCSGSADYVAPAEYMIRPPMPPSYFFLIDVSSATAKSGMLQVLVDTIKSCLDKLPGFPRTQVGFLTFDSALHFYNLKSSLLQPHMLVVGDLEKPFLPVPADDLLVNLSESRAVVDALLDRLPTIFATNDNVESALGPALQVTLSLMGELGGKLLIFQSTLPSVGAGALKLRGTDSRIYNTEKEHTLRVPEDPFYRQVAAECSKLQIGVNVYAFYDKYTDVATLGTLSKVTGGQVCYYPGYDAAIDAERLRYDVTRDLTRETAWEAVMRIRCGKGLKYSGYHGHYMLRSSDLLALPAVDCDKTFAVQLALDETLLTSQYVFYQVALLYTSSNGERRIRVHTGAVPVVSDLGSMYQAANVDAIMGVLSRLAIDKSLNDRLDNTRQFIQMKMHLALREYRNLLSVHHQQAGRFVFPESLTLLPLYVLTLCKTAALRGGFMDVTLDARSAIALEMMVMSLPRLLRLLYPLLIRFDEYILQESGSSPKALPLSIHSLEPDGAYLLFDGMKFVLWLGNKLQPGFVNSLVQFTPRQQLIAPQQDNEVSRKLHELLSKFRKLVPELYQPCEVVLQGNNAAAEMQLLANLYEDRVSSFPSYDEWMVQTHRQAQQ